MRGWGSGQGEEPAAGDAPPPPGPPGSRGPRGRFMPPTGLEPARMNRKKGDKGFESPRPYKLTHQVVCINNINFQRKSVVGFVELTIFPTVANLNRIKLNSKQCRIYRVRINDLEAAFIYNDPTLEVCHNESKQRNLNYFSNAYAAAVSAVDPDAGNGELCIKVPSELWKHVDDFGSHVLIHTQNYVHGN